MNWKVLLKSILLCTVPAASQYTLDTIHGIVDVGSMVSIGDAVYLDANPLPNVGSVVVIRDKVMSIVWPNKDPRNHPKDFTPMNGLVYFCANDMSSSTVGPFYNALWKTDGVSIAQKIVDERVSEPVALNNTLYFRKFDYVAGHELWKYSEGAGAQRIKDIFPNLTSSYPTCITAFNNRVFFWANHPSYGYELWTSDGTEGGTYLLKDINPGTKSSAKIGTTEEVLIDYIVKPVAKFTEYNGALYFIANDGVHGYELWRTDGSAAGTYLVKDILPGAGSAFDTSATAPKPLFSVLNNVLYFVANDGVYGKELWRTDGTNAGTYLLKDINPGSAGASTTEFKVGNGLLFFDANDGTHGLELWRTDGSAGGTVMVSDIQVQTGYENGSYPRTMAFHLDGKLYFNAHTTVYDTFCDDMYDTCVIDDMPSLSLYRTDGTASGTEKVFDYPIREEIWKKHMLVPSTQGLFILRANPATYDLWLLNPSSPLIFESEPVTNAISGVAYRYNIKVVDADNKPISISAIELPSWMTLNDNGNGTATLSGTPLVSGSFNVSLRASTSAATALQNFTVTVAQPPLAQLAVYFYDEMGYSPNQTNVRMYVVNKGVNPVSNFKVEYYFTVENGKIPVLDKYYTGDCAVSLVALSDGNYKIVYDYSGITIHPGQTLPNLSGSVVGLHYSDYSFWDKTNDYSNSMSSSFTENNRICVFAQNGTLIYGNPPLLANLAPVAIAGESITVIDAAGDGENILLNGSASYDLDGYIVSYDWYVNGVLNASGRSGYIILYPGVHTVCLRVVDDDGQSDIDTIIVTVLNTTSSITFNMSTDPVQINDPVVLSYSVPEALAGVSITYTLQRAWDVQSGTLVSRQGKFAYSFWEWTKSYFGGSGPWELKLFVNGILVDTKAIRFAY